MKKYIFSIIAILVLCAMLLLIYVARYKPVSELMKSPAAGGENAEIQTAFEDSVGKNYKMKAPLSGNYRSTYIEIDIDGDESNEVLVFYQLSDGDDVVRMNFLKKNDDGWYCVADICSDYGEVRQVEFADLNNDGIKEIIVGWGIYNNSIARSLCVYELDYSTEAATITQKYSNDYSDFKIIDVDNDGTQDILKVNYLQSGSLAQCEAVFVKYQGKSVADVGSILLTPAIGLVTNITSDFSKSESVRRIFVDGYKADSYYLTDCIFWDEEKAQLERFYAGESALSVLSARINNISCRDVNDDGMIEVPSQFNDKRSEKNQALISWLNVSRKNIKNELYQIVNEIDGYSIDVDGERIKNISVVVNESNKTLTVLSNEESEKKSDYLPIFAIKTISFGEKNKNSFFRYLDSSGNEDCYCRIFDKGEELKITKRNIKESFSFIGEKS